MTPSRLECAHDWEALHRRHHEATRQRLLRRFGWTLGEAGVDDALQRAWEKLLVAARDGRIEVGDRFGGLLALQARRLALDAIAAQRRAVEPDDTRAAGADPERRLEVAELLDHAVAAMSPREREVFRLVHGEGLDYAAIARRLGIRPGAVRMTYARARKRVRQALEAS